MTFQSFFAPRPACLSFPKQAYCGRGRPLPSSARWKARLKRAATGEGKQKRPDKGVPVAGRRMNAMCGGRAAASRGRGGERAQASLWNHPGLSCPRPGPAHRHPTPKIHLHEGSRSSGNAALLFLILKSWDRIKLDLNYFKNV